MRDLARPVPSPSRRTLGAGWQLAEQPAGVADADLVWQDITQPELAAAALRRLGRWSLDAAPKAFDASRWHYRCAAQALAPSEADADPHLSVGRWVLGLDGLATSAQVSVDGEQRLDSRNMFRRHELALASGAVSATPELHLAFDALDALLAQRRARPRWRTPMVAHPQLRWWRTTLLGRTPGWTPPAAAVGPWGPIWMECRRPGDLLARRLQASVDGRDGLLLADLWFEDQAPTEPCSLRVDGPTGVHTGGLDLGGSPDHRHARLVLPEVALWWPHTHGTPHLYTVSLVLGERVQVLGQVGFRRIEVDRSDGGFSLHVNGEPVFCRGACWMPLDVVSLRADATAYADAVAQVAHAGMNMLRLAGPTVYEDDAFFDACDAHGVLVWQDLMFANMDFPGDDAEFLADVQVEVQQQLARIAERASLAVVCGNSEVEQQAAMSGGSRELWAPALFHEVFAGLAARTAPLVPYWPSSAHGGAFPHQPSAGTTSYYGVGAYLRPLDDALTSGVRFATEALAVANIPAAATLARSPIGGAPQVHTPAWKARVYRDQLVGWDFDDVREHYVRTLFQLAPEALRASDPQRHLLLGRLASAELMARSFALWRTASSRCAGALIWYLRDLWAGAGCGVVDDHGAPKANLHALTRVLQPVFATVTDDGLNGLTVHLVNETARALTGAVEVTLIQHGEVVVARGQRPVQVDARGRLTLSVIDVLDAWMDTTWAHRFGPRAFDLAVLRWTDAQGGLLAQSLHVDPVDMLTYQGPTGLQGQAVREADGRVRVDLVTRSAAYGVHFDVTGWQASDEFFHLPPGGQHTVWFTPAKPGAHWHATVQSVNARQWVTLVLTTP